MTTQTTLENWKDAKAGDRYQLNCVAVFTLKRSDGEEKKVRFKDEPGWVLIKGTGISNGECTPAVDEHDRFDFNKRGIEAWWSKAWPWLKEQMREFSDGKSVRAFYVHPHKSIGGFVP